MGRIIAGVLAIAVLLLAGVWAYRLGAPHLTQAEAQSKDLDEAEYLSGPRGTVVVSAKYYPEASKLVNREGLPIDIQLSGCPSWFPVPYALCPPISVWAVRVHIPGQTDSTYLIDGTTGAAQVLIPGQSPR